MDYADIAVKKSRECSARNREANHEDIVLYHASCGGNVLSAFSSCTELADAAWCALAGVSEKMSACFEKANAAEQKRLTDALARNEKQEKIETEKLLQGQYAAAETGTDDLQRSLQQERERAGRLEQDLAAARRDVETQTALAAKATDDASQMKQAADYSAAELRKSLQQDQERASRLEADLAAARRDVETQTALATKLSNDASQQEQERARRLEQDLAAARHDVETQTALVAKAHGDAAP